MNSIQSYILEHLFDTDSKDDLYKVGDPVADTEIINRIDDNYVYISNNEIRAKSIIINPENINKYINIEKYFHPKKIFLWSGKYFYDATVFNGYKIDGKGIEIQFPGFLRLDCHQLKNISIDGSLPEKKEGLLSIEQGTAMMKLSNVQITGFSKCECNVVKFTQFDNKCKFEFDELKFPKQSIRVNAPKCFDKYEERNIFNTSSVEVSKEDMNDLFDTLNINSKQFNIRRIRFVDDNDFEFKFLRKGFKWYYVYTNSSDFYKHFGKSQ